MDDRAKWYGKPGTPDVAAEELSAAIAALGNPQTLTLDDLPDEGGYIVKILKSKAGRRSATRVFWRAGYAVLENPNSAQGLWHRNGKNVRVYEKRK